MSGKLSDYLFYSEPGITLYCGDCREVLPMLSDVNCVVTSPPYNQAIGSFVGSGMQRGAGWIAKTGKGYHGAISDSLPEAEYQQQQIALLDMIAACLAPRASVFYNHKIRWRNSTLIHPLEWVSRSVLTMRQEIVWARNGGIMLNARMFNSTDERIYWLDLGEHNWNQEATIYGSVWTIAARPEPDHPCPFPIELPSRCISATTTPDEIVCDPHSGIGTTLEAAKNLGRRAIGIERSDKYCEIAVKRLRQEVLPL